MKIYFGELIEPAVLISHVRKLKGEADALVERLGAIDLSPTAASLFNDLTIRYGLESAQALSRWAEDAEREIEARLAVPTTPQAR